MKTVEDVEDLADFRSYVEESIVAQFEFEDSGSQEYMVAEDDVAQFKDNVGEIDGLEITEEVESKAYGWTYFTVEKVEESEGSEYDTEIAEDFVEAMEDAEHVNTEDFAILREYDSSLSGSRVKVEASPGSHFKQFGEQLLKKNLVASSIEEDTFFVCRPERYGFEVSE